MAQPPAGPGTVLAGRYRLESMLGRGGMGVVWLAHDEVLDRPVAVKEVHTPVHPSEGSAATRERMLREARAAARLDHPGAVRVYDVVDDEHPWLVMEVLSGRSLAQTVDAEGPLPERRVASIGVALVDTLTAAHAAGILHRDVKPGNVQLCDDDRVVLTDFGIAHVTGDASITQTGDIVGSPAFMSPERARGQALGPPTDLFSLGSTLYTAVEGSPPFAGETPVATLTAVVGSPHTPYRRAHALAPVLDGLLVKDAAHRLDAADARRALAAVAAGDDDVPVPAATTAVAQAEIHTQAQPHVAAPAPARPDSTVIVAPVDDARPLPPPRPRRSSGRYAVLGLTVVLCAALVGAAIAAAVRDGGSGGSAAAGPFSPGRGPVPANWAVESSEAGWSVAVPPRWSREDLGDGAARFRRTGGYGYLAVFSEPTTQSPRQTLTDLESGFAGSHAEYQRVALGTTDFRDLPAALWHFTYTDGGADLEASQLAFSVGTRDGPTTYVLWWQTNPEDFEATSGLRDKLLAGFRPAD